MQDENTGRGDIYSKNDSTPERSKDEPVEAEYHYLRPKNGRECIDAGYIPKDDAPPVPRYRYVEPEKDRKKKNEKRRKAGGGLGRLIAACLICAVLGGTIGGGLVAYLGDSAGEPVAAAESPTSQISSSPAPASIASDDSILVGSQIYELGCLQTVGVTTEVTTRNIFGQTSTRSVAGSGFIIRADGYIITNYHVIETAHINGFDVKVFLYDGSEHLAEIIGVEEDNDIAVLKIEAENLSAVTIGDSNNMSVGEVVYAVGNPLGELTYTMTTGSISALNREISVDSQNKTITMFQIDAAVNSGNSGGPVFNSRGAVIGIVTAKYQASGVEGLGFAIPINDAISISNSIIENGYVTGKAYLGIESTNVDAPTAAYYNMVEGVFVRTIKTGSCSETAGMKSGDIITKLGDSAISSILDLTNAMSGYLAGDTVTVTIFRNGEYLELTVIFDEAPSPAAETKTQYQNETPETDDYDQFPYYWPE